MEHSMYRKFLTAALGVTLFSSCASLGDPFLLAFDVDSSYQSAAMLAEGKDAYRTRLLGEGDVSASASVQRYFEAALRYDPNNSEAARYLVLVEDYRASRFSREMKNAETLHKKPSRSPDEEYAMLVAIRRAVSIYPRDDSATRLLKTTADVRKSYVSARLADAEAITTSIQADSKDSAKERLYIDAFNIVTKALDVEPKDPEGTRVYRSLKSDILSIVQKRLDGVHTLYDKASYDEAKAVLSIVKELNAKIDRAFDSEIEKAEYGLYLSWAKYHEGRKEWSKAQTRISTALSIQKGGEALALQKRIASAADAEERGATLETGLKNLDAYIARGDLIRAQRLLVSLTKTASDASGRKALDQRRKIMIDSLSGIYASALKAYREERFKDAIGLFETVVAVDSSFEDASGYLEKARTKQKLLDQY
ncbi:MAG: hypothetical protein RBT62_07325 [Spirochaetia bacterium]|nr:hypothetical protein [Spirochaetia bacterium]